MQPTTHNLADLFSQLGLDAEPRDIDRFIARHRPMRDGTELADGAFWSPTQAQFLREVLNEDAEWAAAVEELNARLHA
jgi:ClpP class serine protease